MTTLKTIKMISKSFPEKNIVLGKDQPQYSPLHAFASSHADVTCCFELSPKELETVLEAKKIKLVRLTFGARLQPMIKSLLKPSFGATTAEYHTKEVYTVLPPLLHADNSQPVTVVFELSKDELQQIKETKQIWVTTLTFGTPYQPIRMEL